MHIRTLGLVLLAASLPACDVPTDPAAPVATGEVLAAPASGAISLPEIGDPSEFDENLNGAVCMKTVPASGAASENAGQRVIFKDDDGHRGCPGGFELLELGLPQ
ncbi:MAG TPA: hypothetical protein VMM12_13465 [Longimicrobiales bacterium]|nr:hypothetical protein [Longimicrobiales bacterium]